MLNTQKQKIPILRFSEFKGEWKTHRLSEFLTRYSENNKDQEFNIDDILSLSSRHGIVNRKELLEDTYSSVNHLNYKKTRLNDFVYGKSISATFPFGLFKLNDHKDGLLSTLYFTFKVKNSIYPKFLDYYFAYPDRANKFLRKYVLVGDRYITADADYLLSGQINLPDFPEQQKVVAFLTSIDRWLASLEKEESLLREYKKGVVQRIFSQEIRLKGKDSENFPAWNKVKLRDVLKEHKIRNVENFYTEVFSVAKTKGVINQIEHLGRSFSAENLTNYKVVFPGDVIYTKSPTADFPFGIIKQNQTERAGVVSTLYAVFTPSNVFLGRLLHEYFISWENTYNYLNPLVQKGAKNTINIGNNDFLNGAKISLPVSATEQKMIVRVFDSIDKLINAKTRQIDLVKKWRKGLQQQLFI